MNLEQSKQILGVRYRVSETELKSVYRKRAIELHPDTNKSPNASELFRQLNSAYAFLLRHLDTLPQPPKPKPNCPHIYRVFDTKQSQEVFIPKDALKEDDLCLQFTWRDKEYRCVITKNTELPYTIKFNIIPLTIIIKE